MHLRQKLNIRHCQCRSKTTASLTDYQYYKSIPVTSVTVHFSKLTLPRDIIVIKVAYSTLDELKQCKLQSALLLALELAS